MGFDKLSAEVGGVPMLRRVCGEISTLFSEFVIVGDGGPEVEGAKRIPDSRPGYEGPLAGLEAGLAATKSETIFLCAGDMPFVSGDLAGALLARLGGGVRAVVPVSPAGNVHPLFAAYSRSITGEVRDALDGGERSMWAMLSRVAERGGVEYVGEEELRKYGEPQAILMNVNSPGDLSSAREILAAGETPF